MIAVTERARKKLQEIKDGLPEDHHVAWDIIFTGFG
jgi:hypothetical protein